MYLKGRGFYEEFMVAFREGIIVGKLERGVPNIYLGGYSSF